MHPSQFTFSAPLVFKEDYHPVNDLDLNKPGSSESVSASEGGPATSDPGEMALDGSFRTKAGASMGSGTRSPRTAPMFSRSWMEHHQTRDTLPDPHQPLSRDIEPRSEVNIHRPDSPISSSSWTANLDRDGSISYPSQKTVDRPGRAKEFDVLPEKKPHKSPVTTISDSWTQSQPSHRFSEPQQILSSADEAGQSSTDNGLDREVQETTFSGYYQRMTPINMSCLLELCPVDNSSDPRSRAHTGLRLLRWTSK